MTYPKKSLKEKQENHSRKYLLKANPNDIAVTNNIVREGDLPTKRLISERNAIKVDALYVFHKKIGHIRLFEFFWIICNFTENGYVIDKEKMFKYMRNDAGYTGIECMNLMKEMRLHGLVEDRGEGHTRTKMLYVPYAVNIDWHKPDMRIVFEVSPNGEIVKA